MNYDNAESNSDVTMHEFVIPYSGNVCEHNRPIKCLNTPVASGNVSTMPSATVGHKFSSDEFLLTFTLYQCNITPLLHHGKILVGRGSVMLRVSPCHDVIAPTM